MALARGSIDADADRVVRRLARSGYKAYLVGGCVRDILLGRSPKDFDVATSATPNEIKQLFRNCRIIGRRFRLAHVFFGQKIIETSTFRANPREDVDEDSTEILIRRDNVFGNETEDARRRDFTINGLFYDVETEEVIDHVGGMADLHAHLVRTIGVPDIRFQEDPVRILRAIKFAARLGFDIEETTYQALLRHRGEIRKCAAPRVLEEVYRMLRGGAARRSMEILIETGVAAILSPQLEALFRTPPTGDAPARPGSNGEPRDDDERGRERELERDDDERDDEREDERNAATWDEDAPEEVVYDDEETAWRALWFGDEPHHAAGGGASGGGGGAARALPRVIAPDDQTLERRRDHAWKILDEIDRRVAAGEEISNALVMAALMGPFVMDAIVEPGSRPLDANAAIIELGQPLIDELRVARRDAERARQILLAQRRLVPSRRRRGRADVMAGRDYFDDAILLLSITERAAGKDTSDLEALAPAEGSAEPGKDEEADEAELDETGAPGDGEDGRPRKRRRRRRGGRRRRRDGDAIEGAAAT